jgi:hypothetical protein
LREERRTLTEELELERQERLEAQQRVKQLTREHPHLELELELKRITEELEQEGRLRNHRERQCLAEELEAERFARSEDRREVERLQREAQALVEELEGLWEERRPTSKGSKGLWGNLLGANNRYQGTLCWDPSLELGPQPSPLPLFTRVPRETVWKIAGRVWIASFR